MEIKRSLFFSLVLVWLVLISAIGIWWLYLITKLGGQLDLLYEIRPELNKGTDFPRLVLWEGVSFFSLLLLISFGLALLFWRDQRKTKALSRFFASLTHELKTPLASMKLQAQVLQAKILKGEQTDIQKLTDRLVDDTNKLEDELDQILQLSSIEKGKRLDKTQVDLEAFVEQFNQRLQESFTLELRNDQRFLYCDPFALKVILRNLIQNTQRHSKKSQAILIFKKNILSYEDSGSSFRGDRKKLGTLFYKSNSYKGSGVGLYLVQRLMGSMKGRIQFFVAQGNIKVQLIFPPKGQK